MMSYAEFKKLHEDGAACTTGSVGNTPGPADSSGFGKKPPKMLKRATPSDTDGQKPKHK